MAKGKDELEDTVATAIADTVTDVADTQGDEDEKLDARASLFVRQVTDAVTKSIADLLKPATPEPVTETIVVAEEYPETPRPRQKRKQTSVLDIFFRTVVS